MLGDAPKSAIQAGPYNPFAVVLSMPNKLFTNLNLKCWVSLAGFQPEKVWNIPGPLVVVSLQSCPKAKILLLKLLPQIILQAH